jgi:hypothetical protein
MPKIVGHQSAWITCRRWTWGRSGRAGRLFELDSQAFSSCNAGACVPFNTPNGGPMATRKVWATKRFHDLGGVDEPCVGCRSCVAASPQAKASKAEGQRRPRL